jgi:hypothetical protein
MFSLPTAVIAIVAMIAIASVVPIFAVPGVRIFVMKSVMVPAQFTVIALVITAAVKTFVMRLFVLFIHIAMVTAMFAVVLPVVAA